MQDAVASADEYLLEDTDTIAREFTDLCKLLKDKTDKNTKIDTISNLFITYYENARDVSTKMILDTFTFELGEQINVMIKQYNELDSMLNVLKINSKQETKQHFVSVNENNKKAALVIILVYVVGIIFFLLVSFLISRSVVNPLKKIVLYMNKISDKDIDFQIEEKRKDEVGLLYKSINKINKNFNEIITNIKETATAVLNASEQLSSVSQQVSERSSEQASTSEEISASMEEMLATINSNTENAETTEQTTTKSAKGMQNSEKIFLQTINSVSDISEKISIISEIADKTDMLSINASIEAAHAGEHGKGFAVVSDEIRKLADLTKTASKEIEKLSKSGILISEVAGKNLTKLIPEISKSALLVKNIALASKEQLNGVEAINNSVQQLSDVTNQNSAAAEELSSSAEILTAHALQLQSLISVFNINKEKTKKIIKEPKQKSKTVKIQEEIIDKKNDLNFDKSNYDKLDQEFEKY